MHVEDKVQRLLRCLSVSPEEVDERAIRSANEAQCVGADEDADEDFAYDRGLTEPREQFAGHARRGEYDE